MLVAFLLQAAVAGPVLDQPRPAGVCPRSPSGDVVVCARPGAPERFRLRPLPDRYSADAPALPKAETRVLGGRAKLAAEAEAGSVGGCRATAAWSG